MKYCILVPVFFTLIILEGVSQDVGIMTYNIKNDYDKSGMDSWDNRKEKMVDMLLHYAPGIIGVQEALYNQVVFLETELQGFSYIGVGRDDGKEKGEYCAILYDTSRFHVMEANTFWLSDTPQRVSVGWDAALERICTYGLFEDKMFLKKMWVFNTHLDHIGIIARKNAVNLIINKIEELNNDGYPVILMGDFNLTPEKDPVLHIKSKMSDGMEISLNSFYGPPGTFNGFDDRPVTDRIDYIFSERATVLSYVHIDDRLDNNRHISDHLPVLALINF